MLLAGTRVGAGSRLDDGAVAGPHTEIGDGVWVGINAHVRFAPVADGTVIEDDRAVLGVDLLLDSVVVPCQGVGDFGDGVDVVPRTLPAGRSVLADALSRPCLSRGLWTPLGGFCG